MIWKKSQKKHNKPETKHLYNVASDNAFCQVFPTKIILTVNLNTQNKNSFTHYGSKY